MKQYLCSIFNGKENFSSLIRIVLMLFLIVGVIVLCRFLPVTETAMVETEKKVVYLTFDDGPSWLTPKVLDVLRENNVKATFFVIGNEITEEREDTIKQMIKDGHAVGIHTFCHKKNEIYCSEEALLEDITKTYNRIYEITGIKPTLYRFPWGSINCYLDDLRDDTVKLKIEEMGLTYYDWNVSGEDSTGHPSGYAIMRNIKKNLTRFSEPVILLHDSKINERTYQVLPDIINMIKEQGYEFDTLENRSKPCQHRNKKV